MVYYQNIKNSKEYESKELVLRFVSRTMMREQLYYYINILYVHDDARRASPKNVEKSFDSFQNVRRTSIFFIFFQPLAGRRHNFVH
jgi:hypothetical protein